MIRILDVNWENTHGHTETRYGSERGIPGRIFCGYPPAAGFEKVWELPVDFSEEQFHRLADYAIGYLGSRVVFTFRNGVEVGTGI